jgi:glycosyltransferase involved in cell wall biosynthesis
MRIAYVSTRSDTIGGSNVHIRDLAVAMRDRGHDVCVLGGGNGPFAEDVRGRGIPYVPLRHLIRAVRPRRDVLAVAELRAALRAFDPQLVSLHTAKAGVVGRLATLGWRVPIVYTPHGWTFTPGVPPCAARLYAALERWVAPRAGRIVNVCAFEQEIALAHRVGRPAQHVVVHNGMPDVAASLRGDPSRSPPVLVMVARFDEPKDHAVLLDALSQCRDLPWTVQFVGDGPWQGDVERRVAELGLVDRVAFLGARRDVAEILARCQAFVLTTRWEGFPRSILEAMRAGLPVVASGVGGVHEAVADGVNGFVVPPASAAPLAERLRLVLGDPDLRVRLGAAGRNRFAERFTFETMLAATLAVYAELVPELDP